MPVIEPAIIARGMAEVSTQVHQLHQLMPRSVDHRALETLAVVATCIFGVGGYIVWAMRQK